MVEIFGLIIHSCSTVIYFNVLFLRVMVVLFYATSLHIQLLFNMIEKFFEKDQCVN